MPRSNWKPYFMDSYLFKILRDNGTERPIRSRQSAIYPAAVGLVFTIHNGKEMIQREITSDMVGHKLGEFVPTRKSFMAPKKKKGGGKKKK